MRVRGVTSQPALASPALLRGEREYRLTAVAAGLRLPCAVDGRRIIDAGYGAIPGGGLPGQVTARSRVDVHRLAFVEVGERLDGFHRREPIPRTAPARHRGRPPAEGRRAESRPGRDSRARPHAAAAPSVWYRTGPVARRPAARRLPSARGARRGRSRCRRRRTIFAGPPAIGTDRVSAAG